MKSVPAVHGLGLFDPENESCTLQTSVTSFQTTRRDMSEDLNFLSDFNRDGCCECGNELCAFIKRGEFVVKLKECHLLKKVSGPRSSSRQVFRSVDRSIDRSQEQIDYTGGIDSKNRTANGTTVAWDRTNGTSIWSVKC